MASIYPLNDFAMFVKLYDINSTTGAKTPLTSGSVTAFLATTNTPTATSADPSLSVSCVHVGSGKWLVFFDASLLTASLMDSLFGSTPPFLIVQYPDGVRAYIELEYQASRPGTIS